MTAMHAPEVPDKRWATLQARAALAGFELVKSRNSEGRQAFQVSRWNLSRLMDDLSAVEAFLDRAATKVVLQGERR